MYILYVDESGDPGLSRQGKGRGTDYYVLVGLAVEESGVRLLSSQLDDLWGRYLGTVSGELHRRDLLKGKPPFDSLSQAERDRADGEVFEIVAGTDLTLFAAVISKQAHEARYRYPRRSDLLALHLLLERFQYFLARRNAVGIVVYDSKGKSQDKELREAFRDMQRGVAGGPLYTRLDNIVETIFFSPSETSRLLQAADFCAHAVFSAYQFGRKERFDQIRERFDRSPEGAVEGWGLKEWP